MVRVFVPGTLAQQSCLLPYPVQAIVRNTGTQPLLNLPVTLTVSGSGAGSVTVTVPLLAPGASTTVHMPGLAPTQTGKAYAQVSLPPDDNNTNNQGRDSSLVTARALTYATGSPTLATPIPTNSLGFDRTAGTMLCRYPLSSPALVSAVRVCLGQGNSPASVGNTVFAVLLDEQGQLLARSANYTILAGDPNNWRTFALPTPTRVTGRAFFVGLAQTVPAGNGPRYYPMGLQAEQPVRDSAYYSVPGDSALTGLKRPVELRTVGRLMVEAQLESAPLALAGPRVLIAFELYPNPAHDHVQLNWPDGFAPVRADVFDLTGRRRLSTLLPGSAAAGGATLDVRELVSGVYLVRLSPATGPILTQRLVRE